MGPGFWLTALGVALLLGVDEELARRRLRRLADRRLVVDDWRRPRAYARTLAGDVELLAIGPSNSRSGCTAATSGAGR